MGFYGNIGDTSNIHFQFDKIFSNRREMDLACANGTDNIYQGRFVLVKYDSGQPSFVGEILYGFTTSSSHTGITLYMDKQCTTPYLYSNYIEETGTINKDNYAKYYKKTFIGDQAFYIRLSSKDQIVSDETYYKLENSGASYVGKDTIVYRKNISNENFDGRFYICTGKSSSNNNAKWDLISDYSIYGDYLTNFQIDARAYQDFFDYRGYDATVWEKTYKEGVGKYIQVARLNSSVPAIEIISDPPAILPTSAYIDSKSSPELYSIHVPEHWGFRFKETEENDPPSELKFNKQYYDFNTQQITTKNNANADVYFNLGKNENNKTHEKNNLFDSEVVNEIKITPTGFSGKKYNDETEVDTYELSVHLPAVGNMISNGYDLIYGYNNNEEKTRPRDISWYEADVSSELKEDGEATLGGKTHDLSTLAGTLNTMHERLGQNIKTYKTKPSQAQASLLNQDYIYYISDLDTYYRIGKKISFTDIPNENIGFKNISLSSQEFLTQTYYIHTVASSSSDSTNINITKDNLKTITKTSNGYTVITKNNSTHYFTIANSYNNSSQYAVKDISIEQYQIANLTYYEPNKYYYIIGQDYYKDTNPSVPSQRNLPYCTINSSDVKSYVFSAAYKANTYYTKDDKNNYICATEEIPDIDKIYYSPTFTSLSSSSTDVKILYQPNKYYLFDSAHNTYVLDTSPFLANDDNSTNYHYAIDFDYEHPTYAQGEDGNIIAVYQAKAGYPKKVYLTKTETNKKYYLKKGKNYIDIINLTIDELLTPSANYYRKTSTEANEQTNANKLFIPNKYYKLLDGTHYHLASSGDFTNNDINSTTYYTIAQVHELEYPFYEAGKYYYYNGEFYHLDISDPPSSSSINTSTGKPVHYTKKGLYVKSDSSKRCPEGMEWNAFSLFVPASVELGLLNEVKDLIPMDGLIDDKISMNGAVLAFDKLYNVGDNKTRDKNTLIGALNTTSDFFYSVKNLIPNRILYVNDFGQITSSEEGLTYQDILALKNLL